MEEHCVFCGASIPDDELWCKDCDHILETLDEDKHRALAALLADRKDRAALCQACDQIKECVAILFDFVKNLAERVVGWLMANENQQREG